MLNLAINTDGLFQNHFPMANLNILKIFQCSYMLQRLPIALEQIKAGLTSENDWKPTIRIHVNKIETRITFKVKSGNYLKCLTPETVKLLGSTKDQITENKTGENVPHLKVYWSSFSPLKYC